MFDYQVERNPTIFYKGVGIKTIGDPHLGREFKTNVPLHRRGEREASVLSSFKLALKPVDSSIRFIVIVGDLFDKFIVSPVHVLKAFTILSEAVQANTDTNYIVLPGNHDLSKDTTKVSSYELFHSMCSLASFSNLDCLLTEDLFIPPRSQHLDAGLLFCAYNPFEDQTLNEDTLSQIEKYKDKPLIAFGHFDSTDIGGKGYIPSKDLLEASSLIVSGHEHSYKEMYQGTTKMLFTGSLQPYSHAEDPESDLYITIDCNILEDLDLDTLKNKNVRILSDLKFEMKESFDCLSLSFKLKDETKTSSIEIDTELSHTAANVSVEALKADGKVVEDLTYLERLTIATQSLEGVSEEYVNKYLLLIATKDLVS